MTTSDSSDVDHPRSDEVKGREKSGYGDRGGFGDQGDGETAERTEAAPDRPERTG